MGLGLDWVPRLGSVPLESMQGGRLVSMVFSPLDGNWLAKETLWRRLAVVNAHLLTSLKNFSGLTE
jgi:hypothetical protein